ncbi:MAG: FixH family protein [Hyphomicrobium sp.]
MSQIPQEPGTLTGRNIFTIFVSFFAVVFAVNAYFMMMALSTHTGVVAVEPYRKGLKYNDRIAASERQDSLGWQGDIAFSKDGLRLIASLHDAAGLPLSGLKVSAILGRPVTTREDIALDFAATAPGQYEAAVSLAGAGAFIANLEAMDPLHAGEGAVYRARKRLWLKL